MRDWSVSVDNGSFDSAGITNDCQDAICEYIWNGFEANATRVIVNVMGGNMQEAPEIHISDNGTGISHGSLHNTFGAFLSSQKKSLRVRLKTATNKGKGRFSYTAISSAAIWDTVYADESGLHQYSIQLDSANKVNVRESDVIDVSGKEHTTVQPLESRLLLLVQKTCFRSKKCVPNFWKSLHGIYVLTMKRVRNFSIWGTVLIITNMSTVT